MLKGKDVTSIFTMRISLGLMEWIEEHAEKESRSRANFIRKVLYDAKNKEEE